METELNESRLLAQFDSLVEQGSVVYNGNYRTVTVSDNGFPIEFRILDGLQKKPQLSDTPHDSEKRSSPEEQAPSGCRPGSDIDTTGYEVATLGSTHLLAINKFPAARPHLLILTQDGFRRQHEALDLSDLTAARQVLASLESRHLLLFNCGIDSGCSRMHKHMQAFPAPDPKDFPLWPDEEEAKLANAQVQQVVKPTFKFFLHRFADDGLPPPDTLLGIYRGLVRRAEREAAGYVVAREEGGEGEQVAVVAHNVIMDRSWLLVVPRRAAGWDGVDTNAAGMLGMVWVHSEEKMKLWMERGPGNVLARLGIPADGI
ncbi:ATP adenylyltransferase-domain-containing protein [Chaetomium strumarium]|uniref:ATP adenylyltransferase-domain-containing protein n=1 Tax=Chaetomium strumarium TaxID=1170767 RepID=A0AAJ0LYW7_9PEZI|nr:ATP adenylyltransferase-domain-containing protein [Chaetomium strumarium]